MQEVAKNGTIVQAYRDSNGNGKYDAGVDLLAGSVNVTKKGTAFSIPVSLPQNTANQFFLVALDGKLSSAPTKTAVITEDSTPPTVAGVTRVGPVATNATTVQFKVTFSENVTGVDAADFQAVTSGTAMAGAITVAGSGNAYTVTVVGVSGEGTLGLKVLDNDSIKDVLTKPVQAHVSWFSVKWNVNFGGVVG